MIVDINCPQCQGKGEIPALRELMPKCTYCDGRKRVPLVDHLAVLSKFKEADNVKNYQVRMTKQVATRA